MPIVSTKGLTKYSGSFADRELKHLLRRASFGVSRQLLTSFAGQTMTQVVDSLLTSSVLPSPPLNYYGNQKPDPDVPVGQTWINAVPSPELNFPRIMSFKSWLVQNYIKDASITEKMTLFLHSFIPISHDVNDPRMLYRNYLLMRGASLGNFRTLIENVTIDAGMLRYLNGDKNQKNSPDENYARELMELFTLGKGYTPIYSESDIKAAAKVLTGFQIDFVTANPKFTVNRHDTNTKTFSSFFNNQTIAGSSDPTGMVEVKELLDMIFLKNEVALHFVKKLYGFFVYYEIDATVEANVIIPLANIFKTNNFEIKPVIKALLESEHFYDTETYGSHIKSPIDFMVNYLREMELPLPKAPTDSVEVIYTVNYEFLAFMAILRQEIYNPPNVSGWEAYYQYPLLHENWITTDTIANRNKIAVYLLIGYKKNGYQIQTNTIEFTKGFSNPSDPNILIADALSYLHTIPATAELKAHLKTILLFNQAQDYYWTNAWNDHIAAPTDPVKKKLVSDLLLLFYKYILELAEYQLM